MARVLADAYERVSLVERDTEPGDQPRRGVPQGSHPHGLLFRGLEILEELFPGLQRECLDDGATPIKVLAQVRVYYYGHLLRQAEAGPDFVSAGRPFLEQRIRQRIEKLPNVTTFYGHQAVGLDYDHAARRITGVRISPVGVDALDLLSADLVVDAMGRNARTGTWLEELGYPRPAEDRIPARVAYATRHYRLTPGALDAVRAVMVGPEPERPQGFMLAAQETDRCSLTVFGYGRYRPTADTFQDGVTALAPRDMLAAINTAHPLDDIHLHQFPAAIRRRYDKLKHFPDGLLVVGEALCSVNPIYGSGITNAGLQALVLSRQLAKGDGDLPRRFFREAAKAISAPWWFAAYADYALPEVSGPAPPGTKLAVRYLRRVMAAAEYDPELAATIVQINGLTASPLGLLRPSVVGRVLRNRTKE
jgi:flavin-dependent dehydrogenase